MRRLSPSSISSTQFENFDSNDSLDFLNDKFIDSKTIASSNSFNSRNSQGSLNSGGSSSFTSSLNRFTDRSSNTSVQGRLDELTNGKLNGTYSNGKILNPKYDAIKPRIITAKLSCTVLPEISNFPNTHILRPDSPPVGSYNVIIIYFYDSKYELNIYIIFHSRLKDFQICLIYLKEKYTFLTLKKINLIYY